MATNFNAQAFTLIGNTITENSCVILATGDTVPEQTLLLLRNTTTNVHVVTLGTAGNAVYEGLAVPARTVNLAANAIVGVKLSGLAGDAFGRVAISCDVGAGAAADVKYYVLADQ